MSQVAYELSIFWLSKNRDKTVHCFVTPKKVTDTVGSPRNVTFWVAAGAHLYQNISKIYNIPSNREIIAKISNCIKIIEAQVKL